MRVCVCVRVCIIVIFLTTSNMLLVSMRTLLSSISDVIRDELLPLNLLIKEMSLIEDKPSSHGRRNSSTRLCITPTAYMHAVKCWNMTGYILWKHLPFIWSVNICIFSFFFNFIFAYRERYVRNQCSSNHVSPETAASNTHWLWMLLVRLWLIFKRVQGHQRQHL